MKNYLLQFYSSVNPTLITGFSPTFTMFMVFPGGGATTPPGITEIPTATGLYYFSYDPTTSIAFVVDGGASLPSSARYLVGSLDPIQKVDEQIAALGTSQNSLIGDLSSSIGSTLTDPTTIFGYLKRALERDEGNNVFTKTSGVREIYTRGTTYVLGPTTFPGASTMLRVQTIEDDGSVITRE